MELVLLITTLLSLLLCALGVLFVIWLFQSLLYKAPYIPLPVLVVEQVASLFKFSTGSIFYDLGSGDGRVVRAVSHKYPLTKCYGVEKALLPNIITCLYQVTLSQKNVIYLRKDFKNVPLHEATAVFLYLWPSVMNEIAPKLRAELPIGAQIISCRFELPGFTLKNIEETIVRGTVYKLYQYQNL